MAGPSICILEVFKRTLQQKGTVVDLDAAIALDAADLSLQEKLSLADAVILATARAHGATVWTQDVHFEGLTGVRYRAAKVRRRRE